MQKKILITGANSYIGEAVKNYLSQFSESYVIKTLNTIDLEPNSETFAGYDVVFHVAGIAHVKETKKNRDLYYAVNRDLTLKIAQAAKEAKVKQFVVLSTMNVYGKVTGHITKNTKPNPINAYGQSKYEADKILMQEDNERFLVAILRPPIVYGKGCKGNYQLLRKLAIHTPFFPNYKNQRSMIYIGNLCEFVKNVIDNNKKGIFFPQNSEYVCTSDMVQKIAECNGKKVIQTTIFNWLISKVQIAIFDKVFGNLTYEKVDVVDKYSFEQSINLCETNERTEKKKDVLFLCQFFYPEYISSATLPYDTAIGLVKAGYKVGVLCGYPKEYSLIKNVKKKEKIEGIDIKRVKYCQLKRSSFLGRIVNYFSFSLSVLFNLSYCKNYKTILVYSNPPVLPLLATFIKRLYKNKLVFVAYDIYPEIAINTNSISNIGMVSRFMRYANKCIYKWVDYVVALSHDMRNFIIANRTILKEQVVVIPNWYKDCSNEYTEAKTDNIFYEKYKGKFVVSYLGNFGVCQDIQTIMEAVYKMKEMTDVQFLFAGHGNKVTYVREFIQKNKLDNIDLYEFLQGDEYHDALAISQCGLVSLEADLVGLCSPSKLYGYMMSGVAIGAIMGETDIALEIKEKNMGFHVKNGDTDKLVDSIIKMKDNPKALRQMQQNSVRSFKENYTTEIGTNKYVTLIAKLIQENK